MNQLFRLFPLLLAMTLFSCEEENVLIDNSGEEAVEIVVDAIAYNMPGNSNIRVMLEPGMHSFTIKDAESKVVEEGSFQVQEGGLINVSKGEYLIWAEWFGDQTQKEATLKQEWIKVGDVEIFGEFDRIDDGAVYIEKRWDFNVDEELPESVRAWEMTDKRWIIKRKIFRLDDAMKHYQAVSAPTK